MSRNKQTGIPVFVMPLIVSLAIVTVLALVVSAVMDSEIAYVAVSELDGLADKYIRVAGKVEEGTVVGTMADKKVEFILQDEKGDKVRVVYDGLRPDAFREGAEAVVEGTFNPSSKLFTAELLQAKCPSKYEVEEDSSVTKNETL